MRTPWSPLSWSWIALALGACASTEAPSTHTTSVAATTPEPPAPPAQPTPPAPIEPPVPPIAPAPEPEGEWQTLRSNGGRYAVRVRLPEAGWQRGTPLEFDVRVTDANDMTGRSPEVALAIDADMPEHLHGINRVPRIERRPDGTFRVENLYLHMPGWWELFFDVRQRAWTERAQMRVDVE